MRSIVTLALGLLIAGCVNNPTPSVAPVDDERLVTALMEFSRAPGPETLGEVPFAEDVVALGLGDRLLVGLTREELIDPEAWVIDDPGFRGRVGPFSALSRLSTREPTTLSVGPHSNCANPPAPIPDGVVGLLQLSVQPIAVASCLDWWSVDVFVSDDGLIAAVTLDLWEP